MHLGAIPSTLSPYLCVDFVNSRFADYRGGGLVHDRLELAEWRRWFVARCGLGEAPAFSAADRAEVRAVRDFLRRAQESRRRPAGADLEVLNRLLARSERSPELIARPAGELGLGTRWAEPGWPAVVAVVAESFARLVVSGDLARVRECGNPDCTWLFVDESHAGSRRWCDVRVCGNLVRVRRHRQAQAAPA